MTSVRGGVDMSNLGPSPNAMSLARSDVTTPSTADWVNVFGPSGYNVQPDTNRNRKIGRVQLPDILKVCFCIS